LQFSFPALLTFSTFRRIKTQGAESDKLFHLKMTGNTNKTYQLEASNDLAVWTALTNCAGPGHNAAIEFLISCKETQTLFAFLPGATNRTNGRGSLHFLFPCNRAFLCGHAPGDGEDFSVFPLCL